MTQISTDEVRSLAQLSNLALSDDEIEGLKDDITNILEYVAQLNKLDTEGVEPTYQVTGLDNVWREDEVMNEEVSREQLLSLALDAKNDQIKVPRVL